MIPSNMLPAPWGDDYFIAGGFAAHQQLATDIDVWVEVPIYNSLTQVRDDILEQLNREGFKFTEENDVHRDPSIVVDNYDTVFRTMKVAVVTGSHSGPYIKPYHVLVTNGNIKDVLNSFDISTHSIALHPSLGLIHGDNWTPIEEEPVVLKNTATTPERLVKIMNRYAHLRNVVEAEA